MNYYQFYVPQAPDRPLASREALSDISVTLQSITTPTPQSKNSRPRSESTVNDENHPFTASTSNTKRAKLYHTEVFAASPQPPLSTPSTPFPASSVFTPTTTTPFGGNGQPTCFCHCHSMPPPSRAPPRKPPQKLELLFKFLGELDWTLSDLLDQLFTPANPHDSSTTCGKAHAKAASRFFEGTNKIPFGKVLSHLIKHYDGRLSTGDYVESDMYSLNVDYRSIYAVRPALTSFAVQLTRDRMVWEARRAVHPKAGLHVTAKKTGDEGNKKQWQDLGAITVGRVMGVLKRHQPLTFSLLQAVATGKRSNGQRRPPELVVTHCLSTLNFSRSNEARLLPLARGVLSLAHSVPADIMAYSSRIAEIPAYRTILNYVKGLGGQESADILELGKTLLKTGFIQCDNVQNYMRQRDQRIGRINQLNIGIAATYCELDGVDPGALDLEKNEELARNHDRRTLTVDTFLDLIDQEHLDAVCSLHWLSVFVEYIPQLNHLRPSVSDLFRTKSAIKRIQLPIAQTKVHPLRTVGKNETVTTELKDSLVDFLGQIGQEEDDHHNRLILVGGDGLTYQKILEVQRYLQFHEGPFRSLRVAKPVLAVWHTGWTDVGRLLQDSFKSLTDPDPSTVGHSASQMGITVVPNEKKPDYYQAVEMINLDLETRMLDCWRLHYRCEDVFAHFAKMKPLPTLTQLEEIASKLHGTFSSNCAIYRALDDVDVDDEWSTEVQKGSPWPRPAPESADREGRHTNGDRVLSNSMLFMRDALLSRELSYAVAEGDVGRVYEILKVLLFTFAGSTHAKYTTYLLETITQLELESTRQLRELILRATLVNMSGRPGGFSAADIMQEYFNRLLEAIVEKKGVEYDDSFIKEAIAPNLHHFARIKMDMRCGIGLAKRSGKHHTPHQRPEVQKLLESHRTHELHKRRGGRVYSDANRDSFNRGVDKLANGKLKQWALETSHTRFVLPKEVTSNGKEAEDAEIHGDVPGGLDEDEDDSEEDTHTCEQTMGIAEVVNGQLCIDLVGRAQMVEEEESEYEESDEDDLEGAD